MPLFEFSRSPKFERSASASEAGVGEAGRRTGAAEDAGDLDELDGNPGVDVSDTRDW